MAENLNFNDQQNVKTALLEYEKDIKVGREFDIGPKNEEYIGHVSHIYDSTNGNEEQVFVLTNNVWELMKIQFPILLQMMRAPRSMT